MKTLFLFLLFWMPLLASAQCSMEEYQNLIKDAQAAQDSGKYDLAINKLSSARVCRPEKEEEINKRLLEVYQEVNRQRESELKKVREVYANDLAYKSQTALRDGDRTTAFRLAEFANEYVDDNNNVTRAFLDALYYNDNPEHQPLLWYSTFSRDTVFVFNLSPDGEMLATGSKENSITIWDLALGREKLTLSDSSSLVSVAFSHDSKRLATQSNGSIVKIWDLSSGEVIQTLSEQTDSVVSAAFSYDGKWLATGGVGGTIRVWNLSSRKESMSLIGQTELNPIALSSDSKRLATASDGATVKIWDLESGKEILKIPVHTEAGVVLDIVFSPDGKHLATVGFLEFEAKIWDVESGKEILTFNDSNAILSVVFSHDGTKFAMASLDGKVTIWDLKSGKAALTFSDVASSISSIAFTPDEKKLVTVGFMRSDAKIWDLESREETLIFKSHNAKVWSVVFSPDGINIATGGGYDYTTKTWDLTSEKEVEENSEGIPRLPWTSYSPWITYSIDRKIYAMRSVNVTRVFELASGREILTIPNYSLCIAFSQDGKYLASGHSDNTVKIWDLASKKEVVTLSGHTNSILCIAFSPDGRRLATGSLDKTIKVWDLTSEKEVLNISDSISILSVAISPDGTRLATGSILGKIKIWDLVSGREIQAIADFTSILNIIFLPDGRNLSVGHLNSTVKFWDIASGEEGLPLPVTDPVTDIAFSPRGKKLAIATPSTKVEIWDLPSRKRVLTLSGHSYSVFSIDFSPDGKKIATASGDSTVRVWDLESGKELLILKGHEGDVTSVVFAPDGKMLASGSQDGFWLPDRKGIAEQESWRGTIKVWDLSLGKEVLSLNEFNGFVNSLAFSPNGKNLAMSSDHATVKIWDLESGKESTTFSWDYGSVNSVAFSPDNWRFAIGKDNTAKIWDLESGKEIATLVGHAENVKSVAFSPDARRLITTSPDSTTKIWELTLEGWQTSSGKNRRLSPLTSTQLETYNLENLLDIHPDNESKLLAAGEVWQIAAFADLYANKIHQTGFPKKEDYERALRLYDYCVKSGEAPEYFAQRVEELKKVWKEKTE